MVDFNKDFNPQLYFNGSSESEKSDSGEYERPLCWGSSASDYNEEDLDLNVKEESDDDNILDRFD